MSDLLNSASLVMIPSGYAEDKVYSVVPSDGSGDLSFTRASNGTRVNSAGLVEVCPWNLVENSENFSAVWNLYQASLNANTTTAPNGTLTADSLIDNSGNDVHIAYQDRAGMVAGTYTISVYAKASTLSHISLQWYDNVSVFYTSNAFNLSNGTTTGANQSIESVGNGWYRCSFTFTTTVSGTQYIYVMLNNGTSNVYVGTGSGTVFIWGAQLNIGSTAKPYFPTTDRLNVPRLTYQNGGGGCPSLLLEKQSTNLALYSEQFDNAAWTKLNLTVSANSVTSPDGTQNADTITDNTTNGVHVTYQIPSGQSVGTAWTCYMKKGSLNYGYISAVQSTTFFTTAIINLTNGAIVEVQNGSSSTGTVTAEDCGNGWYRVKMQTNANGAGYAIGTSNGSALSGTYKEAIYTGTGSGTIYLWGAQLEDSTYATSYIPTTSSSATRVADACFKTGISSLIGQTEGVIFYDGVLTGISNPYANLINSEKNVTGSFAIGQTITGSILAQLFVNGSSVIAFDAGSYALGTRTKIAFAYKSGSFALYANGTQLGTSAATFTPVQNIDDIYIGDVTTYFNYKENTQVNQVALFKTRLTNSELASLTTI